VFTISTSRPSSQFLRDRSQLALAGYRIDLVEDDAERLRERAICSATVSTLIPRDTFRKWSANHRYLLRRRAEKDELFERLQVREIVVVGPLRSSL
jgi:hypothetical protein